MWTAETSPKQAERLSLVVQQKYALFWEEQAETGGYHVGQQDPRSYGRPVVTSEDENQMNLSRHFGKRKVKAMNFQVQRSAVNHGWYEGPGSRWETTRLQGNGGCHFRDFDIVVDEKETTLLVGGVVNL